ncbi:MAG: glycosyl hydrolase, partial [Limisphaerales bacterium]
MNSNGITADLEAMQRVGIGGVLIMEVDQGAPKGPADFGSPQWRGLFQHVCAEAHRLGLEVNMNNDAGWCGSGGPWITPELAMQKVVWSETNVEGPLHFEGVLAQPPSVSNYYRDIAVLAFPTPVPGARLEKLEGKAAFTPEHLKVTDQYEAIPAEQTVLRRSIQVLTAQCDTNGQFAWDVPAGKWTILRLGHTTTGKDNHPAPEPGRGLESDKLSRAATDVMFQNLMGKLIADSKPLAGRTLISTHIDSWETGSQNWTPRFREDFEQLRGYDPLLLLPVLTGTVVDSAEVSERFLWDVRQTVSDLLVRNYAGEFRRLANQHGMRLSIEAYDGTPCDDLTYAGQADEPMAEFWSWGYNTSYSCVEMSSAAHVYGKRILGAEAFTATDGEKWQLYPGAIKTLGDWAFCEGINRFVFHRYALQPWLNRPPGMSMG